jgi:broad specificity phosphatase PhoE
MRLVLVRHGASEHSRRGVIADVHGCTGLTADGVTQAQRLARRLRVTGELHDCAALLCSPVLRARQTAEVLAGVLPTSDVIDDQALCELRPGAADGLAWADYRARYGAFDLLVFPDRPFSPGGESWHGFIARVRTTLTRFSEQFADQTVVAVSHAGFIVASLLVLFDIPRPGTSARFDPLHTSLTEWRVRDTVWQLVCYNDAYHLFNQE